MRQASFRSVGFLVVVFVGAGQAVQVSATPIGDRVGEDVNIAIYQHYLEDLLYTHLGDNRGFGPEHDLARDNIVATLEDLGLPVELEPFTYASQTYYNVVATQVGTELPDEIVVVGAHFDSVNNPGADDNGTGTAMVMEMARLFSQHRPRRTIMYVLFDREEQGKVGSEAFVSDHAGENIIMAVTADMIGHDSGAFGTDIYSTSASSPIANAMADAIDEYTPHLTPYINVGNFSFSDHWSFESQGIPAFVMIERNYQLNDYYHTPNDAVDVEPGYINYDLCYELALAIAGYLADYAGFYLYGDFDEDVDVDGDDAAAFHLCYTGPDAGPVDPSCLAGDFDGDNDVDCLDWDAFVEAWDASGTPPNSNICNPAIPTTSQWGLVAMTLLILTGGTLAFSNRKLVQSA
ncbi:MAG: M28 family metallopeptidase [Planctomycetota bacterium]